eukprot:1782592-Prymnesium_polylepis.1
MQGIPDSPLSIQARVLSNRRSKLSATTRRLSVTATPAQMDQFLLTSMWGLPVSGPDNPDSSSIQGSAYDLEIDEDDY